MSNAFGNSCNIFLRYKISPTFVLFVRFDTSFLHHADHIVMRYTLDFIAMYKFFLQRLIIVTTSSEFMFHFTSNIFASPLWFVALFRVSLSCLHIITEFFNVYNIYFVFQTFHLSVIYNSSSDPIFYFIFIPFFFFYFYFYIVAWFYYSVSLVRVILLQKMSHKI